MCGATLCGYRSYSAIADWGRCYGQKRIRVLGFTHDKTPWAATLYHVLRQLDATLLEATLGADLVAPVVLEEIARAGIPDSRVVRWSGLLPTARGRLELVPDDSWPGR